MAIDHKKVLKLQEEWGDKPCSHPTFQKEIFGIVTDTGYIEPKTGDYVCTQCGYAITAEEYRKLMTNRLQSSNS